MFKKILHTRTACRLFSLFVMVGLCSIFPLLHNFSQHDAAVLPIGLFLMVAAVASLANFISTFGGADLSFINLSKPHLAILAKDKGGDYIVQICRFPFWSYIDREYGEENAESLVLDKYKKKVARDTEQYKKKCESGPVRVITEPCSDPTISSAADAYKHIETLLEQYAPEKVEAIRKIKAVFEKE